jgi:hypothetical protein
LDLCIAVMATTVEAEPMNSAASGMLSVTELVTADASNSRQFPT